MRRVSNILKKRHYFTPDYPVIPIHPIYPVTKLDMVMDANNNMLKSKNPEKINAVVGAYRTEKGKPYVFNCVKKAISTMMNDNDNDQMNFEYQPICGNDKYINLTASLYFGNPPILNYKGVQTIGGTGALYLAGKFLKTVFENPTIYVPNPTWENHINIFKNSGVNVSTYEYLNKNGLFNFDNLMSTIKQIPNYGIILLHGCAHNPTGYDLTKNEWEELLNLCINKRLYIVIDLAYLGFASGNVEKDSTAIRLLNSKFYPSLVCTSYSKNFGLYSERIGSLFVSEGKNVSETQKAYEVLKSLIRTSYSSSPSFGSKIITTILTEPDLKKEWESELVNIHRRYTDMRFLLRKSIENKTQKDFSSITDQCGMFWYTRNILSDEQIAKMQSSDVFFLKNGRISLAGLNLENYERFVDVFSHVVCDATKN